jgi:beta-galactosidase
VPSAEHELSFRVSGAGILAGTDNGREDSASGYHSPRIAAFRGKALAIVRAGWRPGTISLTVTSPGLESAEAEFSVLPGTVEPAVGVFAGAVAASTPPPGLPPESSPAADASYSGAPDTIPAMMLDRNSATGWSNYCDMSATANILAVSSSNASDWVSLSWRTPQSLDSVAATFVTGGALSLPASIAVTYWNGHDLVPVQDLAISWATASGQPTAITFSPVTTSRIRLTMTSPAPGTGDGFLRIAELRAA